MWSEKADWSFGSASHSFGILQAGWKVACGCHIGFNLPQHTTRMVDAQFDQLQCPQCILHDQIYASVEGMGSGSRSKQRATTLCRIVLTRKAKCLSSSSESRTYLARLPSVSHSRSLILSLSLSLRPTQQVVRLPVC